jgi:lipid-binding SYLF domain-containing protein
MNRLVLAPLTLLAVMAPSAWALPPAPAHTLHDSNAVLAELAGITEKGIPPAVLADAQGVAIIPHVIKAGFLFGGRGGHGVVLMRDRNGVWGEPAFVDLGGASFGFQAGVESADVVLVFKSYKSLDRILNGKGKLTLGADAAIAAGPIGRQAEAGTDLRLHAEIVSYSRSRGLFAGVALDGAALVYDHEANDRFRREMSPELIQLTESLRIRLTQMSMMTAPPPPVVVGPPLVPIAQPYPVPYPGQPPVVVGQPIVPGGPPMVPPPPQPIPGRP